MTEPIEQEIVEHEVSRPPLPQPFEFLRENLECLTVAFLMALVIRHFVFEPFQIPTGSMATTLLGKHRVYVCKYCDWQWPVSVRVTHSPRFCNHCLQPNPSEFTKIWSGEKILANKMVYSFRPPRRWETAVFRPPHEKHLNFIKRIIALGGETISIVNGDIHIDGKISTKPHFIQEQVWIPIYDSNHDIARTKFFATTDGWVRNGRNDGFLEDYSFENAQDSNFHQLRWSRGTDSLGSDQMIWNRLPYNLSSGNRIVHPVGDLKIEAEVSMEDSNGVFATEIEDGLQRFRLELGRENRLIHFEGLKTLENYRLPEVSLDSNFSLSMSNWDNHLRIEIDEKVVFDQQLETLSGESTQGSGTFFFAAQESSIRLKSIKVFRDIYYTPHTITFGSTRSSWQVEKGRVFVLGDNTNSSSDSRVWKDVTVPLENFKGRPWLRLLHLDFPFLNTNWDWVKFGTVH